MNTKVNIYKSNHMNISFIDLKKRGPKLNFSEDELDLLEKAIYGDVKKVTMDFYPKYS